MKSEVKPGLCFSLIAIVTSINLAQTVSEREPRTSWAASFQVSNLSTPKTELTDGDGLINPAANVDTSTRDFWKQQCQSLGLLFQTLRPPASQQS